LINIRYHIVSLVAVFLALGLGMLIGAGVLDRATVSGLERSVRTLRGDLSAGRQNIKELRDERNQANALVRALAPRATREVLTARQVVYVRSGGTTGWEGAVSEAIKFAGAADAGGIVFTNRWSLEAPKDRTDLASAIGAPLAEADPADAAAAQLGEHLAKGDAPELVTSLEAAGFLQVTPPASGTFAAAGGDVVLFAASAEQPWLAAFARAAAAITPTLVVAPSTDALGTVDLVRNEAGSKLLSTFDSAADDPSGVGSVLALRAAIDQHGAHFGRADGLPYVPPAP
jgi:hypothetical protein